jgi:hypothetical protein
MVADQFTAQTFYQLCNGFFPILRTGMLFQSIIDGWRKAEIENVVEEIDLIFSFSNKVYGNESLMITR